MLQEQFQQAVANAIPPEPVVPPKTASAAKPVAAAKPRTVKKAAAPARPGKA